MRKIQQEQEKQEKRNAKYRNRLAVHKLVAEKQDMELREVIKRVKDKNRI